MEWIIDRDHDALIVVDVQNDFLPGGSLAVPDGDEVVPVINSLVPRFETVVYTRDWHPSDHTSFSDDPEFVDGSWPPHCIQETEGAEFHQDLTIPEESIIISKATESDREAYSGFQRTDLEERLKERDIERVFVVGLAEDVCVHDTVIHALDRGFETILLEDGTRGIDNPKGSVQQALDDMAEAGAKVSSTSDLES